MNVTAADVADPNVQRFLNMLSAAEGTTRYGYATAFGGGKIASLADHPRITVPYGNSTTSAAGRYQFEKATWDGLVKQLGLKDFGPASQDLGATQLIANAGELDAVKRGDFRTAINGLGNIWASLPSSQAKQPKRSWDFVMGYAPQTQGLASVRQDTPLDTQTTSSLAPPITVKATKPAAISTIFDAYAKQAALVSAPPPVPSEPPLLPLSDADHQALSDATDRAVAEARERAQAAFVGDNYVPQIDLPPSIDDEINKYLAQL